MRSDVLGLGSTYAIAFQNTAVHCEEALRLTFNHMIYASSTRSELSDFIVPLWFLGVIDLAQRHTVRFDQLGQLVEFLIR